MNEANEVDLTNARTRNDGIKVDKGVVPLAGSAEEKIADGLDGLRDRLCDYRALGARFTKWRVIAGDTKSGKSWLAGLLCEQLILHGYCVCVIDAERKSTPSSLSRSRSTVCLDLMSGMTRRTSFPRLRPTAASIRPSLT